MRNMNNQKNGWNRFTNRSISLLTIFIIWLNGCAGIPNSKSNPVAKSASEPTVGVSKNFKVSAAVQKDYEHALEYMQVEQYPEAIQLFKKVAQKDSRLSGPWVNIGIAHRVLGELDKANEAIETALKINPNNAFAYNQAGIIKREQGEFEAAMKMYQKALVEHGDYANAHLNLAILCDLYLQKIDCAKEHYQAYQLLDNENNKQVIAWLSDLERRNKQSK